MSQAEIKATFPRLARASFLITSPPDRNYNCIAYAADDVSRFWWPTNSPFVYWPPNIPRQNDLQTFMAVFQDIGYTPCSSGDLETGFDKVALFADAQGVVQHAAKQLPSGRWTSKLGLLEDISHTIYGLEGSMYGAVVQYMKRPKAAVPPGGQAAP